MESIQKIIQEMMEPGCDLLSTKEVMDKTMLPRETVLLTIEKYRGLFESCVTEEDEGVKTFFWLRSRSVFQSVFKAWHLSGKTKNCFLLSKKEEEFFDILTDPTHSGYRSLNSIKDKTSLFEHDVTEIAEKFERINILKKTKTSVGFTATGQYVYFVMLINKIFFPR
jgi:hypothetical protein